MKGVGYFIGAAALTYSYYFALGILLALIVAAMPWAAVGLSNQLGRARKENITLRTLLLQRHNVNVLSAARFFLFGCRDMWFEVRPRARSQPQPAPFPAQLPAAVAFDHTLLKLPPMRNAVICCPPCHATCECCRCPCPSSCGTRGTALAGSAWWSGRCWR